MLTATGIGETSALQILGELAVLPDTLDARQWVAFSGLILAFSNRENRSKSGPESVAVGVAICGGLFTCQPSLPCVVILICDASIKT